MNNDIRELGETIFGSRSNFLLGLTLLLVSAVIILGALFLAIELQKTGWGRNPFIWTPAFLGAFFWIRYVSRRYPPMPGVLFWLAIPASFAAIALALRLG